MAQDTTEYVEARAHLFRAEFLGAMCTEMETMSSDKYPYNASDLKPNPATKNEPAN